ncbi:U3 small nucleolar ribonucleoprotein protein Lcp5p [[Candida] jaroonii]|uniref:U3 small nucleolar ribonucleoprotein protein Lcp5p n=1 Tax=[Candida] jaroonii TaxID=467808 RepID=A0ACA9Y3H4_9ASCO|nr:U3 small nucleolar ribonucleoprotein protein Lcp5p [[Candida] jaroonii]
MDLNSILKGMIQSLDSSNESIEKLINNKDEDTSKFIQDLLNNSENKLENVSLLDLKNNSILSYINNLTLIILSQIQRIEGDEQVDDVREKAIENSIIQRITLEKGIKPLEKKLNYQLEKMIRSYNKMETDFNNSEQKQQVNAAKNSDDEENNDDSESESESEDELSYKPDASSLMKKPMSSSNDSYKPPKISAMAPPTNNSSDGKSTKKLQSMEEYLKENSDLPMEEKSIGVNIVNHGRGGVKTSRDREKEKEIQTYEEENFTRLPTVQTKKDKYQKKRELQNTFAGEDFSIFNNNRNINESTSRKRKNGSVWDKVKRRK